MFFKIPIRQPEWLQEAARSQQQFLRLLVSGRIPESIRGWMVVTHCRRLLRCVYGSDLEAAAALRQMVIDSEMESVILDPADEVKP